MENLIILKILQQFDSKAAAANWSGYQWLPIRKAKSPVLASPSKSNAGFTAIEIVIVVLIIGILSAIAAPSWFAFNKQQRVNKANDAVLGALQQAQREAKRTKLSYSVSFRTQNQVPQVATYLAKDSNGNNVNPNATGFSGWQNLGKDFELKQGQVILYTNINGQNQATASTPSIGTIGTITFNYMGALDLTLEMQTQNINLGNTGLIVTVAAPQAGNPTLPIAATKRCVIVKTLIGGMQTAKDPNCN
jgi:prepilin-type N-terminal cleavage/methylation domain-containing protein